MHKLVSDLQEQLPELRVDGWANDYFEALKTLNKYESKKKVVLFLGSNIGNFKIDEAVFFIKKLANNLNKNDLLLIGFDLKKDPNIILEAYNDKSGITKAFNLNLLRRINDELGGNFNLTRFDHFPVYNPLSGSCKSYLISNKKQKVNISSLEESFDFNLWEPIFMEVSQKYDLEMIQYLAENSGFKIVQHFFDCKHYFVDTVWKLNT
ncbi:L-histidine N(alpha)-methyltransferase [Bacteroidota bacterium]